MLVYRSIRKGEHLKVNRLLMANGYVVNPKFIYNLVTTENPKKKNRRLIVAVIGKKQDKIVQMSVAPKFKWTDVLAFALEKERTQYSEINLRLRPEHVFALVKSGWSFVRYSHGYWKFSGGSFRSLQFKLPYFNEKGGSIKFESKPAADASTEKPYVIGERVANLWEYIQTDPEYRRFADWKPTIQITTTNLYEFIPMGKRFRHELEPEPMAAETLYDNLWAWYANGQPLARNDYYRERERFYVLLRGKGEGLNKWLDDKNVKATKRIQKFMYDNFKFKLEDKHMETINIMFRNHGTMTVYFEYEFAPKIDWRRGDYGDSGSCWMFPKDSDSKHNEHFSAALNSCGHGLALKVFQDGKGVARAFGSVEGGHLFLFNYKSASGILRTDRIFRYIASDLGLKYEYASLNVAPDPGFPGTDAYIEEKFACISRNPVSHYTLQWFRKGDKDRRHYVPVKQNF